MKLTIHSFRNLEKIEAMHTIVIVIGLKYLKTKCKININLIAIIILVLVLKPYGTFQFVKVITNKMCY